MTVMMRQEVQRKRGKEHHQILECFLFKFKLLFASSVLYLPKNLYKDRQLPYLIGSKEWQENRHIGLINADDTRNEPIDGLHKSVEDISNDNTSMSISNSERASEHDIDNEDEGKLSLLTKFKIITI